MTQGMHAAQQFGVRLAACLVLALCVLTAEASHFRFGHLTWEPRPEISPTTVDFRLTIGARRGFYSGSGDDGRPQVGDTINMINRISFGDGTTFNPSFEVIAASREEDWVIGIARTSEGDVIRKTYPTEVNGNGEPWRVVVSQCCRLGTLRNAGGTFRLEARVNLLDGVRSPLSSISPVVSCARGALCQFAVPAVDPDGTGLRWRDALGSESGISRLPSGGGETLVVDEVTGIVSWATNQQTRLGLYSVPLQIEDLDADGEVRSSVPLEFIVRVQDFADNAPPRFDVPPSPSSGETLSVPQGMPVRFIIQASDPDAGDTVHLNNTGLPAGASFEVTPGNPGHAEFRWIPGPDQLGEHLITFTAVDDRAAAAPPHPVRIEVVDPMIRDIRVTAEVNDDRIVLDPASFATDPESVTRSDGVTRIEWYYPTLPPDAVETLDFAVAFRVPEPGERRQLTRAVKLAYTDINGNRIRQELEPQYVDVLPSVFGVEVATDRTRYGLDDTVAISSAVANLSRFNANADLVLSVVDADGALVQDLGLHRVESLGPGESQGPGPLFLATAAVYAGTYRVRAVVLDETGQPAAEAFADFVIEAASDLVLHGTVWTDRPEYDVGDTVSIRDRIQNTANNLLADNLTVVTRIIGPDDDPVWEAEDRIAQLPVKGLRDLHYRFELGRASPGAYRVLLAVFDGAGELAAADATVFTLRSTADSGVGLVGALDVAPRPVLRTERLTIDTTVANAGNADVARMPVSLSLLDPVTGQLVAEWRRQIDKLGADAELRFRIEWDALAPSAGDHYRAVLRAEMGEGSRTLAVAPVAVADKLDIAVTPERRGRLLVLLDGPERMTADACERPHELELAVRTPLALRSGDSVLIELYDSQGGFVDSEQAEVGSFAADWAGRGAVGRHVVLTRLDRGRLQLAVMGLEELAGPVRVAVTVQGEAISSYFDSGYFAPDCMAFAADHGDFRGLVAWGADGPDPHGGPASPGLATQRRALEELLRAHGWVYDVVTDGSAFDAGIQSGDYGSYVLFQEHVKLPEAVQRDLVRAIEPGAGLLVAGRNDLRSGRVESVLGVRFRGRLPHADGLDVQPREGIEARTLSFHSERAPLRAELAGASVVANYTGGHPQGGGPAVTLHQPGDGRSAHFGFDWLVEHAIAPDAGFAELLLAGLTHVVAGSHGSEPPRGFRLAIANRGQAASGELIIPATPGLRVLDSGHGRIKKDGEWRWRFELDEKGQAVTPLWLRRDPDGPAALVAEIRLTTAGGEWVDYGSVTLELEE